MYRAASGTSIIMCSIMQAKRHEPEGMGINLFIVWNVEQPVGLLYVLNDASKEA